MNILITNCTLDSRSGTTIVVKDLSYYLKMIGHKVAIYSPQCGALAEEIRSMGIEVVEEIAKLQLQPDIIHGHHILPLFDALHFLPSIPAIYVCHDFTAWHDEPIYHPNIIKYIGVGRLTQSRINQVLNIPSDQIPLVHNSFNESLFKRIRNLPIKPLSCLVYSKYPHIDKTILPVCKRLGLQVDVAGSGFGLQVVAPENILSQYDIVFASGMGAIEALASGAAVILCDGRGAFGMITTSNYKYVQEHNLGFKTLDLELSPGFVEDNINKYNREDAALVSQLVRQESQWKNKVFVWEEIYLNAVAEFRKSSSTKSLFSMKMILAIYRINMLRLNDQYMNVKSTILNALQQAMLKKKKSKPLQNRGWGRIFLRLF
jgi:hypothetical protein